MTGRPSATDRDAESPSPAPAAEAPRPPAARAEEKPAAHPGELLQDREPVDARTRYLRALQAVPDHLFKPSSRQALKRLLQTVFFCALAVHALSIAPAWALPVCWVFAGFAFIFLFEVGHDCSTNSFFGLPFVDQLVGCISLAPLVQPAALWSRRAERTRANRLAEGAARARLEADHLAWAVAKAGGQEPVSETAGADQPAEGTPEGPRRRREPLSPLAEDADEAGVACGGSGGGTPSPPQSPSSTWSQLACDWSTRGWHVSHAAVGLFALVFLPYVAVAHGPWALVKFWLVPFALFHLYMGQFVKQGTRLSVDLGVYLPRGWLVDWQLRSYLRFQLAVPSYRLPEAADRVKRMWSREAMDGADGPPEPIDRLEDVGRLHDKFALGAFVRGWSQLRILDSALSLMLRAGTCLWVYLLYRQASPADGGHHPAVAAVRQWLAESSDSRVYLAGSTVVLAAVLAVRRLLRPAPVYLVDFVTYTAPKELEVNTETFRALQRRCPFDAESLDFMDRLIERTGLGQRTYLPPGCHVTPKPDLSFRRAREEAEMVIFGVLDQLFASTGTRPRDVDILIVNCSLFNPTPSMACMIINRYKMREDVESYNLGGMGCSAHVVAVHLAKDLLRARPNALAVVVSTENITMNWYFGKERNMLVSNTLFRVGGGACLFSSRGGDRSRSKYRVLHTVRTHRGADDQSFNAVFQTEDENGVLGVRLSKELMRVAGEALKRNITTLGPLVLPLSEQARYVVSIVRRKVLKHQVKAYVPRFKSVIDHFCVHAGGRAVIDGIQEALQLEDSDLEASRATLHRYGNVSSASVLYELAHLERSGKVSRGHKLWLVAFGSGFSANSAIYEAL